MTNQINHIRKAISMEIIKPQIQLFLNKGEFSQLVAEALADLELSAAIKRILNPLLANKFPQFPEFTVITLGDTDESGLTQVTLKQPPVAVAKDPKEPKASKAIKNPVATPIKSIEPVIIDEPEVAVSDMDIFDTPTPAYVEPNA